MHDHSIRDTKKTILIPPSEKIEATYMYAPTPPEPTPEPEEDPDAEGEDQEGNVDTDGHKKNGKGPGNQSSRRYF